MTRPARAGRRFRRGPGGAPWAFLLGLLLFGVVLAWGGAQWLSGRSRYPEAERREAWSAISDARRDGAAQWAPDALVRSEASYRSGVETAQRAGGRFYLLRDYRTARDCFVCTAARARTAGTAAVQERASAREHAAAALDRARTAMADMNALVVSAALTRETERLRRRASVRLAGATGHFGAAEYRLAEKRAGEAERMMNTIADRARARVSRFRDPQVVRTWRRWVDETVQASRVSGTPAIVVIKAANRLDLYTGGKLARSFTVDLGRNRLGRKLQVGDLATPEGRYTIVEKKGPGSSRYHLALLLDYPTQADLRRLAQAKKSGAVAREVSPGKLIEIHGEGGRGVDWTSGCIALSNPDIDTVFAAVAVGTPVAIVGAYDADPAPAWAASHGN